MIQVRHLGFTYPTSHAFALQDLTFEVKAGEIFGFLGPSGSGKSTTQKILIGLLKNFEGAVTVFGEDLRSWRSNYYEKVGVCFELPNHYLKLTALENLSYFRSLYSGETEAPSALLERVNLQDDADLPVSQFSKGMKIRLNFARALVHKPDLIFLDEPAIGLDPVNARLIKEIILQKKAEGKTIFLTTHNMTIADELCDRVAFLVDGQIRLIDSPRELKLKQGERRVRIEYRAVNRTESKDFPLKDLGSNGAFQQLLRDREIETIHTMETTLENIFIQETGRRLA